MGAVAGTAFHCGDSGRVNAELFLKWLHFFFESIPPSRPMLLILDGHSSHISIEAIEFVRSNDVHMLCIPAHTTHILQPLDVGVFKSFYYTASKKKLAEHPNGVITTEQIAAWSCRKSVVTDYDTSEHYVWILKMWHNYTL